MTKFETDPTTAPVILFILSSDIVETYVPDENGPIAKMASYLSATILFVRTRYFGDSKLPTGLVRPETRSSSRNKVRHESMHFVAYKLGCVPDLISY